MTKKNWCLGHKLSLDDICLDCRRTAEDIEDHGGSCADEEVAIAQIVEAELNKGFNESFFNTMQSIMHRDHHQ